MYTSEYDKSTGLWDIYNPEGDFLITILGGEEAANILISHLNRG